MSTVVTLSCVNLNKVSLTDKTGVYPRNSLDTLQQLGGNNYYVSFASLESTYNFKQLTDARYYMTGRPGADPIYHLLSDSWIQVNPIVESWNPQTLTYYTKPNITTAFNSKIHFYSTDTDQTNNIFIFSDINKVRYVVSYGVMLRSDSTSGSQYAYFYTQGSNSPYLRLEFDSTNASIEPIALSPSSGFVPKYSANTFTWSTHQVGTCIGTLAVSNCKFRWRTSSSASYTEIDCGTNMSCTIPANTFTTNSIQWCAVITDNGGTTTASDWYTLSTEEVTSTASADSPKNTMIDGSVVNTFSWSHIISTGTAPTRSDLQKSINGTTWAALATVTGSDTTTTIAANTFTSGQWYWRVRTYNTDNVAGAWSDAVSFISVASPVLQGVSATQTPRPTVSWQCSDQQGYQVKIGSYDSGVRFGTAQNFKYPGYLADGTYTVKVRVVNQYGLWSAWQTASCTVSNTAGTEITLLASHSDAVANLSWSTTGTYSAFILYRNNVPIYKGTDTHYTDNLALNSVSYKVRGVTTGSDNYTLSNVVDAELIVDCMMIADINSFNWMRLDKSTSSSSEINLSHSSSSIVEHISGAEYPVLEMSEYKDKILSGKAAFTDMTEAKAFSNLNGKCVVVKTPKGDMVVGLLSAVQEVQNTFFYGFSFSVQHTFLLEEVDI